MTKKLLSILFISSFVAASAIAGTNVGIKGSYGDMSASGSHTTNSGSIGSGGAAVNSAGDANFPVASIFVEKEFELSSIKIILGLDYVPYDSQIEKLDGGDGLDATLHIGNVGTLYLQPMISVNDNVSLFLKAGYTSAKIDITELSRQASSSAGTASTNNTASTDGSQSKTLEGPVMGVGAQVSFSDSFIRFEYTNTDFDEIQHTNSNGKVLKAQSDVNMASISFGKSF